ncbi:hypothetical protein AB1L42_12575 [Thalassoglobus sp. JC818]|uniref:hypothetical protein n=1 Tax=Thalassoglobus sp. JC818 TaxID=3232136 RepID=UPI00345AB939
MDAKLRTGIFCLVLTLFPQIASGATAKSRNFVVTAPTDEIASKVAKCAEIWRKDLAVMWLGQELPNWYRPCPISVKVGQIGAGGSTTFTFDNGEVFGWNMKVQGTLERILDSVIPHEVNHTIFASYFRRPLPRWADEGAATLVEHDSERARQSRLLDQVIRTHRRIPLPKLLTIREYPEDMHEVLTLYAEGYSLADFLVSQKGTNGRAIFLQFLEDAHNSNWETAIAKHYGHRTVGQLEEEWTGWVLAGSPEFQIPDGQQLAANSAPNVTADLGEPAEMVIRSQTPDAPQPLPMFNRELRTASSNPQLEAVTVSRTAERNEEASANQNTQTDYSQKTNARGDAGESRPRSIEAPRPQAALSRNAFVPTGDGISSHADSNSYRFPKVRSF